MTTIRRGLLAGLLAGLLLAMLNFVTDGTPGRTLPGGLHWFGITIADPTISQILRLFLAYRAGRDIWSHLWCSPEAEIHHDESRAPLWFGARRCLVARLLTRANEHHEPCILTFQPPVWEFPLRFSYRPALRVGIRNDLLPVARTAYISGIIVANVREKHVYLLCSSGVSTPIHAI